MTKQFEAGVAVGEKHDGSVIKREAAADAKICSGIVGAGLMGRWHAHALEKTCGKVVAVADSDIDKARRFAARFSGAEAFADVEKMLNARKPDVLHVCSPIDSHPAIAETGIKAGVHLLIEKPLTASAVETARLYELASEKNILLCPVHQFVFQDGVLKAKERLARIGRLLHLEARICSAGSAGLAAGSLDRIAADILPHPLSLMQVFLRKNLSAVDWHVLHPASGELRILGQTDVGATLSIFISMNSRPTRNRFRIFGTNGTIHLDLFHGFSIIESGKTSKFRKIMHPFDFAARNFSAAAINLGRRTLRGEPAYPGLRRLIAEFYDAVKGKIKTPISPAEAIAIAEIRDLLMTRADTKQTTSNRK